MTYRRRGGPPSSPRVPRFPLVSLPSTVVSDLVVCAPRARTAGAIADGRFRWFHWEWPIVTTLAALLAVALTWPLTARLGSAGRVDSGDGRYSVWNVGWVARALATDPTQLFNANMFYPHDGTLAFSEPNLVAGVLALPVWLATHNALAAANSVTLIALVAATLAAFALVRHLTGDRVAAALAGVAYGFCPYAFAHLAHIQLLMTFGPPLALLALHRFVASPTRGRAAWLGAAVALEALACGYYGVFGGLAVMLGLAWFSIGLPHHARLRFWKLSLLAGAVALALVAPVFQRYVSLAHDGFGRTLDDARLFSTTGRAYFVSAKLLHRWMLPIVDHWREVLFPGFVTVALAGVAVVGAAREWRHRAAGSRVMMFYVLIAALGFALSLGPNGLVYTALYRTIPIFSFLRAPVRAGLLVTLSASVLAGFGLARIGRRASGARRTTAIAVVLLLATCELPAGRLTLAAAPSPGPAYRQLAALPWGPVAEFPFFNAPADRHRHTEYMLMSTFHWKPLINGYSDFTPDDFAADVDALNTFPSRSAWTALRDRRVRYVMMHWDDYSPRQQERIERTLRDFRPFVRLIVRDARMSLYELGAWPNADSAAPSSVSLSQNPIITR